MAANAGASWLTVQGGEVDERVGRCKRSGSCRALVFAACLVLVATFAAPAAAGGPKPDPSPGQKRAVAPDSAPQAAKTAPTTHAASTSPAPAQLAQPTSTSVPSAPTQPAVTPSRHHASARALGPPRRAPRVARHVPPPSASPAARVLRALAYDRLIGDVRAGASSLHDNGLLILGAAIILLIVLGEVGFLTASVRLLRRTI